MKNKSKSSVEKPAKDHRLNHLQVLGEHVKVVDGSLQMINWGESDFPNNRIIMQPGLSKENYRQVAIHELLEYASDVIGVRFNLRFDNGGSRFLFEHKDLELIAQIINQNMDFKDYNEKEK